MLKRRRYSRAILPGQPSIDLSTSNNNDGRYSWGTMKDDGRALHCEWARGVLHRRCDMARCEELAGMEEMGVHRMTGLKWLLSLLAEKGQGRGCPAMHCAIQSDWQ